jgi:hypothetical protein
MSLACGCLEYEPLGQRNVLGTPAAGHNNNAPLSNLDAARDDSSNDYHSLDKDAFVQLQILLPYLQEYVIARPQPKFSSSALRHGNENRK